MRGLLWVAIVFLLAVLAVSLFGVELPGVERAMLWWIAVGTVGLLVNVLNREKKSSLSGLSTILCLLAVYNILKIA